MLKQQLRRLTRAFDRYLLCKVGLIPKQEADEGLVSRGVREGMGIVGELRVASEKGLR